MSTPLEVFCCYAHEDQLMLEHLKKHLVPLQRQGQITIWSDSNLNAGVEWEKELHQHLESADLILLLVSPDFMASDYCYSTEMGRATEHHNEGSARVIPILLRSTLWQNAPFAKLQVVPTNGKPITNWSDRDDAFHNITEHIHHVVSELQSSPTSTKVNTHSTTEVPPSLKKTDVYGKLSEKDSFKKLEKLMPELLTEMRQDLSQYPLRRELVLLKKSWSYWPGGNELTYYYDEHEDLENKMRILCNYNLTREITFNNVKRYNILEELAEYLHPE